MANDFINDLISEGGRKWICHSQFFESPKIDANSELLVVMFLWLHNHGDFPFRFVDWVNNTCLQHSFDLFLEDQLIFVG
jgi:hypothetical protein